MIKIQTLFRHILSICAIMVPALGLAQEIVQPKIMVVPKTTQEEDVRTVLEADPAKRIALTVIKEAFDNRNYTTVDFLAKLKNVSIQQGMQENAQQDLKTMIINQSGADIYVEAEVIFDKKPEGNKVNLILTAYDISTGNSLSNKVGESRRFYTEDVSKLSQLAVNSCVDEFLNTLQSKFTDIVENGRTIQLNIVIADTSSVNLSDDSDTGNPLADVIEEWVEQNAYKNNYHMGGSTDKQMTFDEIRIPVRNAEGKDFKLRHFRSPLMRKLKALGLNPTIDTKGNSIFVTIN